MDYQAPSLQAEQPEAYCSARGILFRCACSHMFGWSPPVQAEEEREEDEWEEEMESG